MKYDLHIHSCLSPCANDDMTPANIAGFAKLNGIDLIAVTDHNAADNLPAVMRACETYGVQLLPGIEVNTAEEIHLLAYFGKVEKALEMSEILYKNLSNMQYSEEIWGRQLVLDEEDRLVGEKQKLLTGAVSMDIYSVMKICQSLGGVAVPAHVDKNSYSLLSVLGFAPEDLPFEAFELRWPEENLAKFLDNGRIPKGKEILSSSDAHQLADISENPRELQKNSIIRKLL